MATNLLKKVVETESGLELWVGNTRVAVMDCHESEIATISDIFFNKGYRDAVVYVSGSRTVTAGRPVFEGHTCEVCK